jgi:hypothetical protein
LVFGNHRLFVGILQSIVALMIKSHGERLCVAICRKKNSCLIGHVVFMGIAIKLALQEGLLGF